MVLIIMVEDDDAGGGGGGGGGAGGGGDGGGGANHEDSYHWLTIACDMSAMENSGRSNIRSIIFADGSNPTSLFISWNVR